MNRSALRGFASGVILATGVLTLAYYVDRPATQAAPVQPGMQGTQSAAGGLQAQLGAGVQDQHAAGAAPNQTAQHEPAKPKPIYKISLKVDRGTTPEDAASQLEKGKVIPDKKILIKYFVNNRLMYSLKRGTHNLNSNMTIAQIASNLIKP
ncbi:hypothetical protein PP175_07375 [Aneurinibacillus sp. Ricciae_BoGa-3]|uniref:hypothetical protein n=1 Tax=Aneurinibacillus sp. Ricciae_BoGa-3 TaxID=3022697 RepID=UPI00234012BA|nr:hypothetical protein [Aneurinibacillus sp. Ricciae_BoGa-3]WCK55752.1 hypothetical protein PP175_07375 [Aneurinibacillus sp. Ricciae_BoGa-3]